jgi:hypothetical protein
MRSMTFPIYIDATTPQKTSGCSVMRKGPGWTPWMRSAAKIIAIDAFPGIPSVRSGMKEVLAAELLADSGPATP